MDDEARNIVEAAAKANIKYIKLGYWPYKGFGHYAEQTKEVKKALEYGAIETLMVCDEKLMAFEVGEEEGEGRRAKGEGPEEKGKGLKAKGEGREEIEALLERVERERGKMVVFSTEFEPGKRLKGLGGIAALLRFPI